MPLHLLHKKSWNVYNPANIARVRTDEAQAAAREAALEQAVQEHEAAVRLARLRGVTPPTAPAALEIFEKGEGASDERHSGAFSDLHDKRARDGQWEEKRKKRRLRGEDDTDRDIRLAQDAVGPERHEKRRPKADDKLGEGVARDAAPITDVTGHIQLFAAPEVKEIRAAREKRDKDQMVKRQEKQGEESADAGALRFRDANGYKTRIKDKPWYASKGSSKAYSGTEELEEKVLKDAFGRDDPRRGQRDEKRLNMADPLAVMRGAQKKLKEVERKRELAAERWKREQERELSEMKRLEKKRRRSEPDEFSLGESMLGATRDRHRSRSRSPRRSEANGHRRKERSYSNHKPRHRSRSRSRDRHGSSHEHRHGRQ